MSDVDWHGRTIRKGDMVIPFMASANRDPRQFPDPDVPTSAATPERHVAFAWGIHFPRLGAGSRARGAGRAGHGPPPPAGPHLASAAPRWKPMTSSAA
jgi:hypothetical protein